VGESKSKRETETWVNVGEAPPLRDRYSESVEGLPVGREAIDAGRMDALDAVNLEIEEILLAVEPLLIAMDEARRLNTLGWIMYEAQLTGSTAMRARHEALAKHVVEAEGLVAELQEQYAPRLNDLRFWQGKKAAIERDRGEQDRQP
jgi:hypothetical protein